jgi:flagellin
MRIRDNWVSLFSWRALSGAAGQVDRSIARLSSGYRINSAADDAAGLGMSQRIKGQFSGLIQANRNALDGISLVQTAESALNEIHSLLQRGRELAVHAANDTLSQSDKQSLQVEFSQLLNELDRMAETTTFNGKPLLSVPEGGAGAAKVIEGLRSGWLQQAEQLITNMYGLSGDGAPLTIRLEQSGPNSTWLSGDPNPANGHLDGLVLHINVADFAQSSGSTGPLFNDRKVARGLVEAVLARNSDFTKLDTWFVSGLADYLAGGDEQLKADLDSVGGNAQAIVNAMNDALTGNWKDDSVHRSAAYLAVKYMGQSLLPGRTTKDVLQYLQSNTLQNTIAWGYGAPTVAAFITDFQNTVWGGAPFLNTNLNLTDADVGAIGGGDAATVVPDGGTYTDHPLAGFDVKWPPLNGGLDISLQIGANEGQTMSFRIPEVSTYTLNLIGLDISKDATEGLERVSAAITTVSNVRSQLGSVNVRLEHTMGANAEASEQGQSSYSRIVDLDMAREVADLTREQIMVQASGAMLAQANSARQHVMWLLKGLPGGSSAAMGTS